MRERVQSSFAAPARRRGRRTLLIAGLGLAVIAAVAPEAKWYCAILFVTLAAAILWPDRQSRRQAAEENSALASVWPSSDMKATVSALDEPILVMDRRMILRFRNPASEVAFGNMPVGDLVTLRFRSPELIAALSRSIESAESEKCVLDERRPVERTWQVEVRPVEAYGSDTVQFFLLVFRDQTPERRVEQMRTDFVANASHELRTPLASLTGFIETLQGPARDDPKARERFLQIMREQAARMSLLIDDLLSLSRIEMKRHVPVSDEVELGPLIEKVVEQLDPVIREYGIEVEWKPPSEPVRVLGEDVQLVQVFSNLLENACKYGAEGGRVEIVIERTLDHGEAKVDVSIRDYGDGIAEEHLPRLTERFYRVNVGTSRARQGTGLGLSIVRNILLRHRASLIVRSEMGQGSTFVARFPALGA